MEFLRVDGCAVVWSTSSTEGFISSLFHRFVIKPGVLHPGGCASSIAKARPLRGICSTIASVCCTISPIERLLFLHFYLLCGNEGNKIALRIFFVINICKLSLCDTELTCNFCELGNGLGLQIIPDRS